MNEKHEEFDETWLDRLDEIVDGVDEPSPDDDELLQLARQVHVALAPLRDLEAPVRGHRQRLQSQLRARLVQKRPWKRWVFRPLMVAAALLLFILLGPGLVYELNPAGQNNHPTNNVQGWHMSDLTTTDAYAIVPFSTMPRGLVLLTPTNLRPAGYLIAVNMNTYGANEPVKSYLIYEQNAILYESPSPPLPALAYSNPAYETVHVGDMPLFVSRTSDGQNRLEWYQHSLLCDFVSEEPVAQLIAMVQFLRPVTY